MSCWVSSLLLRRTWAAPVRKCFTAFIFGCLGDFLRHQEHSKLPTTPLLQHSTVHTNMPAALDNSTKVFILPDKHNSPLTCPYFGHFQVVSKSKMFYNVDPGTRLDNIYVDQLKLAPADGNTLPPFFQCSSVVSQLRPKCRNNTICACHSTECTVLPSHKFIENINLYTGLVLWYYSYFH